MGSHPSWFTISSSSGTKTNNPLNRKNTGMSQLLRILLGHDHRNIEDSRALQHEGGGVNGFVVVENGLSKTLLEIATKENGGSLGKSSGGL